jgi:hypothetical protein
MMPRLLMALPPSLVIVPPLDAPVLEILLIAVVVSCGFEAVPFLLQERAAMITRKIRRRIQVLGMWMGFEAKL